MAYNISGGNVTLLADDRGLAADDNHTDFISFYLDMEINGTTETPDGCVQYIPSAGETFHNNIAAGVTSAVIGTLLTLVTIAVYVEEIIFIRRTFTIKPRKTKTIWILALFPVYAVCSFLGVMVPRAGVFVGMVSNAWFSTCVYQFVMLMIDYMGGAERMWETMKGTKLAMHGPPCCCCCKCLPTVSFNRRVYRRLVLLVLQVAIIRPLLMFFAAVLWADGVYHPGEISVSNGYVYIQVCNLASTFISLYGLMLIKKAFRDALVDFHVTGKLACFQLVLVSSVLPNILMSIIVFAGALPCNSVLNSDSRAERISSIIELILTTIMAFVGRHFYRRYEDGDRVAAGNSPAQQTTITAAPDPETNGKHPGGGHQFNNISMEI